MADRTPSMVSTSSSRIADGSISSSGATDTEWGASVESEVEWGDAGIVGCGIGGAGTDHVDADGGDGTGCNSTVSDDQVPSVAALTFSIQKTYRHLAARLEQFLTIRARPALAVHIGARRVHQLVESARRTQHCTENDDGRPWISIHVSPAQQTLRGSPWTPVDVLAEGVGCEPTEAQKTSTVFETVPFVHSGSLPVARVAWNHPHPMWCLRFVMPPTSSSSIGVERPISKR